MDKETFKPGDLVELKGGLLGMVVEEIDEEYARVIWDTPDYKIQRETIKIEALQKTDKNK